MEAVNFLASFHLPLGHILKPVHIIGIGPLTPPLLKEVNMLY